MKKVEIFENDRAKGYTQFVDTWIPNYHYFLDRLPKLLSEAAPRELLVAGCGTGNEIERFIETPGQWKITGVDPSPEMILQARKKFQDNPHITLIEGVVSDLSTEKKFGAATLLLVLHFFDEENKLNLLSEIAKRLLPGASFITMDICGDMEQIKRNLPMLRLLLPDGLDEEQINARLQRIENEMPHISENRLSELFQKAGFEPPLRFFQSAVYMGWFAKKK